MSTTTPITIPRTSHATLAANPAPLVRSPLVRSSRLASRRVSGASTTCTRRHGLPLTVSATSLDVDGEIRAMVRPRVPNYALRRALVGATAVVAFAFGLLAAAGLAAGVSGGTASAASAAPAADLMAPSVHVARAGDTMWSIANLYRGEVGHGRYLDALIDANGGVGVQTGAAVQLP